MTDCAALTQPLIFSNVLQTVSQGNLDWQPLREGIEIARLYVAADGASMAFLRFTPGARLPRHVHEGYEHIYILQGTQHDDAGQHVAGALLVHPPGTSHAVVSPTGCLVLAFWERPVRFL